jgi:hypothetical protein
VSNTISNRYRLVVSVILVALAAVLALSAIQASRHVTPRAAVAAGPASGNTTGSQGNPDGTPWG